MPDNQIPTLETPIESPIPPVTTPIANSKLPLFKIILISFGAILLILILILLITSLSKSKPGTSKSSSSPTPAVQQTGFDINLYNTDTDKDQLPDFIEAKMGLDPKTNEVEGCLVDKCNDPKYQQAYVPKHNVLIILDSSGSMNLKSGDTVKMEAAKHAITSVVNNFKDDAQIGLMVYGHLGSNAAKDKSVSCAGADTLAPIGNLNTSNVNNILSSVKPTGWTPIGLALQKAKDLFVDKERDDNEVYVVTDGAETCDTDPVSAAAALASGASHVKVNVIGFAVGGEEEASLKAINTAGKGTFESAKNQADIEDIFSRHRQNWASLTTANDCVQAELDQLAVCTIGLHNKIDAFRAGYTKNSSYIISQDEYNANEKVYYAYIMYLQQFESQKTEELTKKRGGFVKDLD